MIDEAWKEEKYNEIFDAACEHIAHLRRADANFTQESLQGLLDSQYLHEGNDWIGRGELQEIAISATIAAYEHSLAEWQKEDR